MKRSLHDFAQILVKRFARYHGQKILQRFRQEDLAQRERERESEKILWQVLLI